MKIGVLGAGFMAERMSNTLKEMDGFDMYAIASSSVEKGERFVSEFGWKRRYGDYDELLSDPEVELVYVAQPTRFHPDLTKRAIRSNKPVLCEKPLCINEPQAAELAELAGTSDVFLAEALWTNFMPSRFLIDNVLKSGELGELQSADIVFRNNVAVIHADRFNNPEMGAGAIMEMGSYTVGACMLNHLGFEGVKLKDTKVEWLESGLDRVTELFYEYENGVKVHIVNDVKSEVYDKHYRFNGTKAWMRIEGTSNPQSIEIFDNDDTLIREIPVPKQITGYEYQWEACKRAVLEGKKEPDEVPLKEVLETLRRLDEVRSAIGLKFPIE